MIPMKPCNTWGKFAEDRNSIKLFHNHCITKVHLKCSYQYYFEFHYIKFFKENTTLLICSENLFLFKTISPFMLYYLLRHKLLWWWFHWIVLKPPKACHNFLINLSFSHFLIMNLITFHQILITPQKIFSAPNTMILINYKT